MHFHLHRTFRYNKYTLQETQVGQRQQTSLNLSLLFLRQCANHNFLILFGGTQLEYHLNDFDGHAR